MKPRLLERTASSYGYLWRREGGRTATAVPQPYHFDRIAESLALPPARGRVLDAGCGAGIDLANQARRAGVEVVGVELSRGGAQASFKRCRTLSCAHVVQADIRRLPFAENSFDFIYSYGVLHHLPAPAEGLRELVRVVKPGGRVAVYLYEDFSDRAVGWRWFLAAVNQLRRVTPHFPHRLLYGFCRVAAPIVYLLFTVPFQILRRVPFINVFAHSLPFRHAQGPFSLAGDLYDRFSAPVEYRYSRAGTVALLEATGLQDVVIAKERGWMAAGIKGDAR